MKKVFLFLSTVGLLHASECKIDDNCPLPIKEAVIGGPSLLFYGSPLTEENWALFLTGDFIYWTVRMDGLAYAASRWRNGAGQSPSRGSVKHPDFEFEPGFKVGLGTRIPHDGWELCAEYTWLHTGNKTSSTKNSSAVTTTNGATWFMREGAVGSLLDPDSPLLTSANTRWDLHFNVIDLELARTSRITKCLDLRPHFGFKGTWQKEHFAVRYEALPNLADETFRRMDQKMEYWGFGMRTGFDASFHLNQWFRLLGQAALSGLWSQFETERRDRFAPADGSASEINTFYTENTFHTIVPILELFLGVRWEKRFNENLYSYMMQIGWEHQVWWKMNQLYRVDEEGGHGDLTLQGLTFQLRLDF